MVGVSLSGSIVSGAPALAGWACAASGAGASNASPRQARIHTESADFEEGAAMHRERG
jgi:hypothetical protein